MPNFNQYFNNRRRQLQRLDPLTRLRQAEESPRLKKSCPACNEGFTDEVWAENLYICPNCSHYLRMPGKERFSQLMDEGFLRIDEPVEFCNPLDFPGYEEKWDKAQNEASLDEAIAFAEGAIHGNPCVLGVMDPYFMMASMGQTVGDRVCHAFDYATRFKLPVVICTASGGARMQEGLYSLMQMRRTAAAVRRFQEAGGFYLAVMTDPTTGGVTASFASLGDVTLAEKQALIGFAGARVIRQTMRTELPEGFQRAEFQYAHGFVDRVVDRLDLKKEIAKLLALHEPRHRYRSGDLAEPDKLLHEKRAQLPEMTAKQAYAQVLGARDQRRISPQEILESLCDGIVELSGDRCFGTDAALRGGLAWFDDRPITWLITEKGQGLASKIEHHYGMPYPEGYRMAIRLMKEAERFGRPIITIIDTPGAYPGIGAEERGQGAAIADSLYAMSSLTVPVISLVSGEAGSGGALGIACADRLYMLEGAIYTILSPEAFATILWKDASRAEDAALGMRASAADCYALGFCDEIFPDDLTGLKERIARDLNEREIDD